MFPMISSYDELIEAKKQLKAAAGELEKEGAEFKRDIEIGVLIEVPSAVVMADVLAREVGFFSIGTNDLIQYSFAIDRGNPKVAHLYRPLHPAIIRMLKQIVDAASDEGIQVAICGEMAGEPLHLPVLLGLGLTELSMNPQFIPMAKRMIRMMNLKECRMCVKELMKETTAEGVMKRVQRIYGDLAAEKVYENAPGKGMDLNPNCRNKKR
ncbi:MAG: hypothetical protein A2V65_11380 [Deltaproteobacteria bacterium RBG_13_49_15]|nr:MAG: hypothetical protein A2V65_11380 [Deltaproteobacteria bacterium RBG_13_49_15]